MVRSIRSRGAVVPISSPAICKTILMKMKDHERAKINLLSKERIGLTVSDYESRIDFGKTD